MNDNLDTANIFQDFFFAWVQYIRGKKYITNYL